MVYSTGLIEWNLTRMLQLFASITRQCRFPLICPVCQQYHQHHVCVCKDCFAHLKPLETVCQICAHPLPEGKFQTCGNCIKTRPSFNEVTAAYVYQEPLRSLLHEFKYQEGLYLSHFIAELMLITRPQTLNTVECLLPVPMHQRRLAQRGYNHAIELTKYLSRKLSIPYDAKLCSKQIATLPQAELSGEARRRNLRNTFSVAPHTYRHVMLVDDLITTGSTLNELANQLKQSGANYVGAWCCARASIDINQSKPSQTETMNGN